MSTVLRSQIQCPKCLQLIASLHRHDFRSCRCGAVSIDGGRDYLRCLYKDERPKMRSIVLDEDVTKEDARRLIEVLNGVRACDGMSADDPHSPYRKAKHIPWVPVSTLKWWLRGQNKHRVWTALAAEPIGYDPLPYLERLAAGGLLEVRYSKTGKRTGWRCTKPLVSFGWYQGKFERRA